MEELIANCKQSKGNKKPVSEDIIEQVKLNK